MFARILIASLLWSCTALAAPLEDCATMYAEIGQPETRATDSDEKLLCRTGYLVSYNLVYKTPNWVLEALEPDRFKKTVTRDNRPFVPDPDLEQDERAVSSDYTNSGYDRGHMSPAADNTWSEEAMAETFYLSNIAPQYGPSMNRGIWKQLEEKVRDWAMGRDRIIVVSGPVYGPKPKTISKDKVAVPEGFFKVIYDPTGGKAVAFYFDNKAYPKATLAPFITTVSDIEEKTGITFFTAVDKRVRARLEKTKGTMWR